MVVTILNVDPGGCRPEKAIPEKASTSPVRGASATMPPSRPPSAVTAACSTGSEIVVRTAGAWRGLVRLSTRAPATSSPPGRAEQALVEDPLEARDADLGVGGHAERGELLAALGRDRAELADDLGRQQRGRVRDRRPWPAPCGRAPAAWRACGIRVTRRRRSPAASPGRRGARDQSMPSPVAGSTTSPATVPNARVGMRTGTR